MVPSVDTQITTISNSIDNFFNQNSRLLRIAAAIITTSSFIVALQLSVISQIATAAVLLASFLVSKSVARGLFAVSAGVAVATVIGSLSLSGRSFDSPNFVFFAACLGTLLTHFLMKRVLRPVHAEFRILELAVSLPLFATSMLLRPITRAPSSILLANLGAEDNASWIHAASGFLRFNATATQASNFQYGSDGFLSTLLSFFTTVSKWGSDKHEIQLVLISVFNTYIFCILIAGFFTVIVCAQFFSSLIDRLSTNFHTKIGLLALSGIPTTVVQGLLMSKYGHLGLITVITAIWITFWMLHEFSDSNLREPNDIAVKTLQMFTQSVIVLMIGSIWFPLIPVSLILMALIISRSAFWGIKNRQRITPSSEIHTISIRSFVITAILLVSILSIAVATWRLLQFPTGYSASTLINADGGTYSITGLVLGLSLLGLLFSANAVQTYALQSVFAIILIFELLAVWVLSLNANSELPGYSVQKFAVLIAAIGIPLTTSLFIAYLLVQSRNWIFLISVPVVVTFALLQISFGINTFPRNSVMEVSRTPVWNYQEDLIKLASENKESQILCLSNSTEKNIYAYICSRFASAFQYKEHGDDELARRWRSQILELSIDPTLFKTGSDYGVAKAVRSYLDKGGSLVIALIPGPLWDIQKQTERQWVKELPWSELNVYWQK